MTSKKVGFNYNRLNVAQSNQYFASGIPTVKVKHKLENTEMKNSTSIVKNSWRHKSNHLHLLRNTFCSKPIVSHFSSKIVNFSESPYTCGSL